MTSKSRRRGAGDATAMPPVDVARSLLDRSRLKGGIDDSAGYLDLLSDSAPPPPSVSQRVMQNRLLARVYEGYWRPMFTRGFSLGGRGTADYQRELIDRLAEPGARRVLDVACGPGLHTREFARNLTGDGVAIGFDLSKPMLAQAVRSTGSERAAYIRGDAHALPFADGTFDTVVCFAALYLINDPHQVIRELARVARPGGAVAIFTSLATGVSAARSVRKLVQAVADIHVFERDEVTRSFADAGLVDLDQRIISQGQFVSARKPL